MLNCGYLLAFRAFDRGHYDKDSKVTATTDRDGRSRVMSYDLDNRLTQEIWSDSHGTPVNTLMYSYRSSAATKRMEDSGMMLALAA